MPSSPKLERRSDGGRRSFGQAVAKLFKRPNATSVSRSSQVSLHQRSSSEQELEPAEFHPYGISSIPDSQVNNGSVQHLELAEEAREACSSAVGSMNGRNCDTGSFPSSKRPSLSEPILSSFQRQTTSSGDDQTHLHSMLPTGVIANGPTAAAAESFQNVDSKNLLRPMPRSSRGVVAEDNQTGMRKTLSFPSSTPGSSTGDASSTVDPCEDRIRHSSFAGRSSLPRKLSQKVSFVDPQPTTKSDIITDGCNSKISCGDMSHDGRSVLSKAAPSIRIEEDGDNFRTMNGATESTSYKENFDFPPRFGATQSLTEFITRLNRIHFDSQCAAIDEEGQGEGDGDRSKCARKESVQSQLESSATEPYLRPDIRTRGYTVGANSRRPYSCPPNSIAAVRNKWANTFTLANITDDGMEGGQVDGATNATPLDALLFLTSSGEFDPPSVSMKPASYNVFTEYLATASGARPEFSGAMINGDSEEGQSGRCDQISRKGSNVSREPQDHGDVAALKSEILTLRAELARMTQRAYSGRERISKLHGRLKQLSGLEEQNQAQRDQLRLQENEIRQLMAGLTDLRKQNANQRQEFTNKEYQLTTRLQTIQRENETLRSSMTASKRTATEVLDENRRLKKELGSFVQRLFDKEAAYTQLQEKYDRELPQAKQTIAQLNSELFRSGEQNRRSLDQIKSMQSQRRGADSVRERLRASEENWKAESSAYRRKLRKEHHKLDAANQRIQELEAQLQKRQAQIAESKRLLAQSGDLHEEQLAACQMKYEALLLASQRQEIHILELYDMLETKGSKISKNRPLNGDQNGAETSEKPASLTRDAGIEMERLTSVDIPIRTGAVDELRSYDSYHSTGCSLNHLQADFGPSSMNGIEVDPFKVKVHPTQVETVQVNTKSKSGPSRRGVDADSGPVNVGQVQVDVDPIQVGPKFKDRYSPVNGEFEDPPNEHYSRQEDPT